MAQVADADGLAQAIRDDGGPVTMTLEPTDAGRRIPAHLRRVDGGRSATATACDEFEQVGVVHALPARGRRAADPPRHGVWSIHNIEVLGDRAYASWYSHGIVALDMSDPTSPQLVGQFVPRAAAGGDLGGRDRSRHGPDLRERHRAAGCGSCDRRGTRWPGELTRSGSSPVASCSVITRSCSPVPLARKPRAPRLAGLALDAGVGVRGEDHDRQVGSRLVDLLHRVDAGEVGHRQVHQHDVGFERLGLIARGHPAARLAGDLDVADRAASAEVSALRNAGWSSTTSTRTCMPPSSVWAFCTWIPSVVPPPSPSAPISGLAHPGTLRTSPHNGPEGGHSDGPNGGFAGIRRKAPHPRAENVRTTR